MSALSIHLDGIGWRSSGAADWSEAAARLRSGERPAREPGVRCAPALLPPNERRRAPLPVLLACEVGMQACAMAGFDAARTRCVFASRHGDIGITTAMCETLADDPFAMSPTRFHNSVLNAAVGYWTVATACHAPSNALTAGGASFAAGLLEAAVEALADDEPALLIACDVAADGALGTLLGARSSGAVALALSPRRSERTLATLRLAQRASAAPCVDGDAIDAAWPLFDALATRTPARLVLPAGASATLEIEVGA